VLCYIFAAIIGAPFWYKVSFKLGIKKVTLIGAILLGSMGLPFLFIPVGPEGLIFVVVVFTIAGFVDSAIITMTMPLFSSVIDNATIETGKRDEGLYKGVWLFFSRIGLAIRAVVFWIVQITFGYHSGSTDPYELMGLRFQLSVFPLIITIFGILVFWRLYQITPEQLEQNLEKLKQLKL